LSGLVPVKLALAYNPIDNCDLNVTITISIWVIR
jgi:hypothetical protein